jgi:hypothetical protein
LSDVALDLSQERHPAIATGLTILDASDTPAGFLYIVPLGVIFRDKPQRILSVARGEQTGFTRNRSVRVWILGVAGSGTGDGQRKQAHSIGRDAGGKGSLRVPVTTFIQEASSSPTTRQSFYR